jgi:hypothetical protein
MESQQPFRDQLDDWYLKDGQQKTNILNRVESRNSSVGIATGYRLDDQGVRFQVEA